jgi:methylglyoxal/glyoxal reductase
MKTILNNGIEMPLLGLGVYDMYNTDAESAIRTALEVGYRLIDTAAMYQNEVEVGNAIRASKIDRKEIFITTKVADSDQGFNQTIRAFETSLSKINCDFIDLYLIHWPIKASRKDTWLALEKLYTDGKVRAIGVANYLEPFLDELLPIAAIVPAVNQVEFSPYLFLETLLKQCNDNKIVLQAYSPLIRGEKMKDLKLVEIAEKYNKTPAQIIIRWALQLGVSTIPKSVNPKRIAENFNVFDFELNEEDMLKIANFNENYRVVDNPMILL